LLLIWWDIKGSIAENFSKVTSLTNGNAFQYAYPRYYNHLTNNHVNLHENDNFDLRNDNLDLFILNISSPAILPIISVSIGQCFYFLALAKNQSMVFVNLNYRRGVLGFLSLETLSKRQYPTTSGNYGLVNQTFQSVYSQLVVIYVELPF
jgi:hypothetical protein